MTNGTRIAGPDQSTAESQGDNNTKGGEHGKKRDKMGSGHVNVQGQENGGKGANPAQISGVMMIGKEIDKKGAERRQGRPSRHGKEKVSVTDTAQEMTLRFQKSYHHYYVMGTKEPN